MTYSKEELEEMVTKMRSASNAFYGMACATGNHAFIEFTGLMNEYIKVCQEAVEVGVDFTECTAHTGKMLPMKGYHADYLGEKLECIYGPSLKAGENAEILRKRLGL